MIESLLEQKIGLSAEAIGFETISKAVSRRMNDCGISDINKYVVRLQTSKKEWEELIEAVVVPETWFFRNKASFAFLGRYVRYEWLIENKDRVLRVLSIPCSTGEEPYSIAMTLLDTGLTESRFHIDGMDISVRALHKAKAGIYGRESFRGDELSFRDRYFTAIRDNYKIFGSIRNRVQFMRGNLMDERILADEKPYDIIFCRNVLIYLSASARKRAVELMDKLLSKNGILFVGHVERAFINGSGFAWIRQPGVFACKRAYPLQKIPDRVGRLPSVTKIPCSPLAKIIQTSQRDSSPDILPVSCRKFSQPPSGKRGNELLIFQPADTQTSEAGQTLIEIAQQLANRGELDEARKFCEKRLNENGLDIDAHFLMGVISHALDDERRAEEYFNKTVYLDPNYYEALVHLAFILEHRGDKIKAEQLRQRAQRILQRENKS